MPNNFRIYIRKVFLELEVYLHVFAKRMNLASVFQRKDGRDELDLVVPNYHHDAVNTISNGGPLYSLGCSPTAASDILKTDGGSSFPNIVPGTLPPDGSEGVFIDDRGVSYNIKSLIATRRSMEYLWHYYQSQDTDPVPGGQDLSVDQVGPFIGGYDLGDFDHEDIPDHNYDGDTMFFTEGPINPL